MNTLRALLFGTALSTAASLAPLVPAVAATPGPYQHVLLLSIDGMHSVDLANWFRFANLGKGASTLRKLSTTGVVFSNAVAPAPSTELPGMMALATGGTPKSTGVYYDHAYDRTLFAPGTGCTGAPGAQTDYTKTIDVDSTRVDAGGRLGNPASQILPARLPRTSASGTCAPVMPHSFLQTNTIFEVLQGQGYRTAWADEHPSYEMLNGPSGNGVSDLYTPEINAIADTASHTDYTQSFTAARTFDAMNVKAVMNEIRGRDSTDTASVGVPTIFGMSFQSLKVGQMLAKSGPLDPPGLTGGYTNGIGKWQTGGALYSQLSYIDSQIGLMVQALTSAGLLNSTLIIVTAKHGDAPINPKARFTVDPATFGNALGSGSTPEGCGNTNNTGTSIVFGAFDDVGLLWLDPATRTLQNYNVAQTLISRCHALSIHLQTLLANPDLTANYNPPFRDSRTPDFITIPFPGVIYTTSGELSAHGGFSNDDRNVALLVSNPSLAPGYISDVVETRQVAPTILNALGLGSSLLRSVVSEGTQPLPYPFAPAKAVTASR